MGARYLNEGTTQMRLEIVCTDDYPEFIISTTAKATWGETEK